MSFWISAVMAAALLASEPAPAAPPVDDATTVDSVTVTARPAPQKEALEAFVGSIASETASDRLGRWDRSICPGVIGMRADYAQLLIDRISATAGDIGLLVGDPGCRANMIVIATADSGKLTKDLVDEYPEAFAKYDGGIRQPRRKLDAFIASPAPVRWWHVTRRITADGMIYSMGDNVRVRSVGRLSATTREDFDRVIIVMDVSRIGKVKFATLADYIAMVGLAQIDPDADVSDASSVLNLFDARKVGATPEDGLTAWDRAYLTGLYAARRDARTGAAQEGDVVRSMSEDLKAGPKDPKASKGQ